MVVPRDLPTDPDFARLVEQCEIDSWLDLDQSSDGARHFDVETIDGAILLLDRSTDWPHSRILNLGIGRPATSETIEKAVERMREEGITTLRTDISPIARPGTLARMLTAQGFEQTERTVTVARHTAGMPQPDSYFRIRPSTMDDRPAIVDLMRSAMPGADDWYVLLAGQVERPQWHHNVAIEGTAISGLAAFHLHENVAWLSPIWVSSEYRNRGTQAALIANAVQGGRSGRC